MNQKSIIAVLGVVVVILIGTTVYFATINKPNQPVAPDQKVVQQSAPTPVPVVQQPAQPTMPTVQPNDETANLKVYTNSRMGYSFSYPTADYKKIDYPNDQDMAQFVANNTSFSIRAYIGEGRKSIESWIQEPNASRAYSDLSKYEKVVIGGKVAYRLPGETFAYVNANGNVYEITAYKNNSPAPVKINSEPLFEKWVTTIQFTK